jgi:hypothetical protein
LLDRAREEHVVAAGAAGTERRVRGEGRDDDLVGRQPVERDEVVLRALRDCEHAPRLPCGARDDEPEDRRLASAHERRVTLERQVLHGEHGGDTEAERERMDEVRELRPDPAQKERDAHGHAELLASGGELERLDAFRDEIGPAGDRSEAQVGRGRRQRAQQVLDVRLVAGSLTSEHVCVDDDERWGHATSS